MGALIDAVIDVLPDSDWAKITGLLVIGFVILVATGRFKLEWIGQLCRHVVRWLRCKICNRHMWRLITPMIVVANEPPLPRIYMCEICGKQIRRSHPEHNRQ